MLLSKTYPKKENVRFELSMSSSLVFYKKMATSKIKFDEICVKSLGDPRCGLD